MAGQLQSVYSRSRTRSCRCNRARSTPRSTVWSNKGGYAPNGRKATVAAKPSSIRLPPPAGLSWNAKRKAGAGFRPLSTWWLRARRRTQEVSMRWIEQFRVSMLMLFRRESQSKRLNDELAFHLEQQVKEN